jgi:hypothetical protein
MNTALQRRLAESPVLLNLWALLAAFATYFFMYMFRKPFTAASFDSTTLLDWNGKAVIVASQVIGYFCSKLMGIRVISTMPAGRRAWVLLGLILASEAALLLFAVLPAPWHVIAIFLNGLPLGMVFGLVLGFLEGRQMTEALVAGLCASFIVAGGFAKTLGQWTLELLNNSWGMTVVQAEHWMPAVAGGLFVIPIAITIWMLSQIPPPSQIDQQQRSQRTAMTTQDRRTMLKRYGIGLAGVALFYLLVTILRSLRDDFAPQILAGMGANVQASDYSWIDSQVAVLVLLVNGLTAWIRSNRLALQAALTISLAGFFLIGYALLQSHLMAPVTFMVLIGAGLYLPYVAVHTTVFERLIALTRDRGNMGFLMYVVDSMGYLGYVVVLFIPKGAIIGTQTADNAFYQDFRWYCAATAIMSLVAALVALAHFSILQPQSGQRCQSAQQPEQSQVV